MISTIDDIAADIVRQLESEDVQAINDSTVSTGLESIWLKSSFTRAIRNEYGLWHNSPLTEHWRLDETARDIRDGIDYSEDHPDNVSERIYNRIVELVKK